MKTTMKNFAAVLTLGCFAVSGAAQADNFECKITDVFEVHYLQDDHKAVYLCGEYSPQKSPCRGVLRLNIAEFTINANEYWMNFDFKPQPAYTGFIAKDGYGKMNFNQEQCVSPMTGEKSCVVVGHVQCELKTKTWGNVR